MSNYSDQIRNSGLMETYWDNHIDEQEAKLQRQNEALYPGELLRASYEEYMKWYATSPNPSAYEFLNFLLRQNKKP